MCLLIIIRVRKAMCSETGTKLGTLTCRQSSPINHESHRLKQACVHADAKPWARPCEKRAGHVHDLSKSTQECLLDASRGTSCPREARQRILPCDRRGGWLHRDPRPFFPNHPSSLYPSLCQLNLQKRKSWPCLPRSISGRAQTLSMLFCGLSFNSES